MNKPENVIYIGKVIRPYKKNGQLLIKTTLALKGNLFEIYLLNENNEFATITDGRIETSQKDSFLQVSIWQIIGTNLIVKLSNLDNFELAWELKGYWVCLPKTYLREYQYLVRDLVGLDVFDTDKKLLGKIVQIFETGANDVFVIKNEEKEILIPALKTVVCKISLEEKYIIVNLPNGLLEING